MADMKKVVLKLELHDEKSKKKAMKAVSGIEGMNSISMDMKDKKLTVTGDIDPVGLVSKLRKICRTEIISVGPAKEPEKKKEEPKKEEPKKTDDKKKDPPKIEYFYPYMPPSHPPHMNAYFVRSAEEDPNACVIC